MAYKALLERAEIQVDAQEADALLKTGALLKTASQITAEDRAKLKGSVATVMEKANFGHDRFTLEVRHAMSAHPEIP